MMTLRTTCLSTLALALLAACGGSGAGADRPTGQDLSPDRGSKDAIVFARYVSEAQILAEELQNRPFTDLDTLPTSGQAAYQGFLGGQITRDGASAIQLSGRADLTFDFQEDDVPLLGKISEVVDGNGRVWSGVLSLDRASISRRIDQADRPGASGFIAGQLQTGKAAPLQLDLRFDANIYGQAYGYLGGVVGGAVREGVRAYRFDGEIIARR